MNKFQFYYRDYKVQYRMLKYSMNREIAFLASKMSDVSRKISTRNRRIHNIQGFQFWIDRLDMFNSNRFYNFYYSMASYKNGIPMSNPDNLKLDDESWNEHQQNEICSYDFLIDIDAGDLDDMRYAVDSAKSIKKLFDELNVPY